ncbi:MAG: hypothetical protein BGO51_08905 [Rhodospirillales bacterium 69-11]|nr:hypothetical protein [Rhodospirillales bacterium]MBN8927194.1 hypothetical protein [Rhodospirillales bacterium]OJW26206.1 MAG: hypothetical protein BGO51_08905 [Rhodospirillales bacterium 69-11]
MADEKTEATKPFPGSPTGNRSGVGDKRPEDQKGDKPAATEAFPGSPTGNASGAGPTTTKPGKVERG